MAVNVKDLNKLVLDNAIKSDKIIIISGFATPNVVEEIAKTGKETIFYYGMYRKRGLTTLTLDKLKNLDATYPNLTVNIVNDYHVHTKCYLFFNSGNIINSLVGSANCSIDGLYSGENSEMLVELNEDELKNTSYLHKLSDYAEEIDKAAVHCTDPAVIISSFVGKKSRSKKDTFPKSSNPYVAYMPLYYFEKSKSGKPIKKVGEKSGLNWGLQSGHARKGTGYAEAYIAVTGELIDLHPILFPFFPVSRTTTSGKSTRRYDPVTVLWDDGTIMEMIFSGNGVERPTKGQRTSGQPFHQYPKQFTSGADGDGGGAELGEYLRKRMNVSPRHTITMKDLKAYGREYIELTYIHDGYYEANFSGTPLK